MMELITSFMARLGALTVAGVIVSLALPKGSMKQSGKRAIGLMSLLCSAEFIFTLMQAMLSDVT